MTTKRADNLRCACGGQIMLLIVLEGPTAESMKSAIAYCDRCHKQTDPVPIVMPEDV
jgi:hypothetical protein